MLTLLKCNVPLSTPFNPNLWPLSPMVIPGKVFLFLSLIGTKKACTPCSSSPTISCAKTVAIWACFAALPIYVFLSFCVGVLMIKVLVLGW